jgi:hypothetical protein
MSSLSSIKRLIIFEKSFRQFPRHDEHATTLANY